jgi:hypothetical protein
MLEDMEEAILRDTTKLDGTHTKNPANVTNGWSETEGIVTR